MKVVLINTFYPPDGPGGAERSVQLLAAGLRQLGHEVAVVVTAPTGSAHSSVVDGIRVHALPIRNVYRDPMNPPTGWLKPVWHALDAWNVLMRPVVRRVLAEERPDLVHTNTVGGVSVSAWEAARDLNIPVVHTLRDYYLLCPKATMFKRGALCRQQCRVCRLYSVPKVRLTPLVSAVVGVAAPILQRHLTEGLFRDVADRSVIPNGVSLPATAFVHQSLGAAGLRLGFLGRLEPSKGPDLLLEAATRVEAGRPEIVLAGRGKPEYVAALQRRFNGPGIRFLGQVPPAELFAQVDFLVVPSRWREPFARVVIEALAHGVPVLCSRQVGAAEYLVEGSTGHLFDSEDAAGLAALMARLTPTDARRMAPSCRTAAEAFRPERIAARYEDLYHRVTR